MNLADLTLACVLWITQGHEAPQKCQMIPMVEPVVRAILKYSDDTVTPALIAATIHHESHWNQHARSPVGAIGLMQILRKGAIQEKEDLRKGFGELCDIDTNIRIGVAYLKYTAKRCRQHFLTLYNQGHGCFSTDYSAGVMEDRRRGLQLMQQFRKEREET